MKTLLLRSAALLALAVALCALPVTAQKRYTIEPSSTIVGAWEPEKNPDVEQLDIKIHIYNTSEEEFSLNWSLNSSNFPEQWLPQVCDNANCFEYKDLVGKTKTMTVGAKSGPSYKQGELKVTAYPKDYLKDITYYGVGTLKITIADAAKPQETDELTFTAKVEATSVAEEGDNSAVEISPNPAGDFMTVTSTSVSGMLSIVSALGTVQFAAPLDNGVTVVNLAGIPQGVYFAKITDVSGKSSVRKFMKR